LSNFLAPTTVNVARVTYLLVCELAGIGAALSTKGTAIELPLWAGVLAGLCVAGAILFFETCIRSFTLRGFANTSFGILVGLFCAWLLTKLNYDKAVEGIVVGLVDSDDELELANSINFALNIFLFASLAFLGAVLAMRSGRDEFAFIIPYVRFRQDAASGQPLLLDADVIMDGRVPRILRISIHEPHEGTLADAMDARLIQTARMLGARLLTTDENLTKVARLQNADVLNINDLSDALKPAVVVGEKIHLALVRSGKDEHQAVGYLPDGTMIVVNHASSKIGTTQDVLVISTLQTSAGQMVFAELFDPEEAGG
jgi:uncharacterized protein YacL